MYNSRNEMLFAVELIISEQQKSIFLDRPAPLPLYS